MLSVLGVDAGGTSTRVVVIDGGGRALGYASTGAGNPVSSGADQAAGAVRLAAREALGRAGTRADDVAHVVVAMAGSSVRPDTRWLTEPLAQLGLTAPVTFESDLLATFCAGTPAGAGYALVAGTGAAAVRVEQGTVAAVSDGLGWLLGDVGSGYWIGHRVVVDALGALDGRTGQTALSSMLLEALGLTSPGPASRRPEALGSNRSELLREAVARLYALRPVQLARFAPLAFAAPDDLIARRIVDEAAQGLLVTLRAVVLPDVGGPIVLGGGTISQHPDLVRLVGSALGASEGRQVLTVSDGAVGAAVLALRHAGVTVDEPVFATVAGTLSGLR